MKKLVKLCVEAGMPAVALTDTNSMFGALEFSTLASGAGVQPIVGCQVSLLTGAAAPGQKARARVSACGGRSAMACAAVS